MKQRLTDNMSYKFVALGVALILWMSMLGRKDSSVIREFEIQLFLGQGIELQSPVPEFVKVELTGPRIALKKLNQISPVFTVDLSSASAGRQVVHLSEDGLTLPIGARILTIEPNQFTVVLKEAK